MQWQWFERRYVRSFWTPIVDPREKTFRDVHVWAHVIGGIVWDFVFHFLMLGTAGATWVSFPSSVALRLLGVGVVQLTLWELIQKENWRPELTNDTPDAAYPWLSAIWDVIFTVAGAAALEVLWYLGTVVLS